MQPGSSTVSIAGPFRDGVKVRLTAPAVEGKANDQLVSFLAGYLGIRRSAVRIVSGERSRSKVIEVVGWSSPEPVVRVLLDHGATGTGGRR